VRYQINFFIIFLFFLWTQFAHILSNSCSAQQITFIPEKMILKGDFTTRSNSIDYCSNTWVNNMPDGSVILGANPKSCCPKDWHGATAKIQFDLKRESLPIIGVLRISWPDRDGKGLHSSEKDKKIIIQFDGQTIWSKRTEICGSNNKDFYAAEHEPIQTTVVLRNKGTHSFTIIIPDKTAWDISRIELLLFEYPINMKGIGYSPYRDCQYPGGNELQQPTIDNVKEDLFRLSHTCTAIRTYSSIGIHGKIPAIAKSLGLKVYAGVSIDGNFENAKTDAEEIKAVIALADTVDLDGIIVGNEYFLRHNDEPDAIKYLLNCITKIKANLENSNIPISTAEIAYFANDSNFTPIINMIDILMIHIYPFWDAYYDTNAKISIKNASKLTIKTFKEFEEKIKRDFNDQNKSIIIGETGWPSRGEQQGEAIPTFSNQRKYLQEFLSLADQENIDFMYFDAFNELWKIEEGLLGQHWGYSYSDRTAKYNFFGVLIPSYLIPMDNIDLPPSISSQEEIPNRYQISSEWPRNRKSFKLTDESIKRICKHNNISNALLFRLKKFQNMEFFDQSTFLDSVLKPTIKYEKPKIDKEDTYNYFIDEKYSKISGLLSKYSTYHYFFPRFMGDFDKISMYECDRCNPKNGRMSTKITFSFGGKEKWCGIYWLPNYDFEIEENVNLEWKDLPGVNIYEKMNISDNLPIVLTFYARGEQGAEKVQFKVKGIKTRTKPVETKWIKLDKDWKKYVIDLPDQDLSDIIGGFCCVSTQDKNPKLKTIKFYLDDIQYELKTENTPKPNNSLPNILESDFHLVQFFGDISSRNTNFFESNYDGVVLSNETRLIFPRFSKLFDFSFPIPDPFFPGALKLLKKIDWEDRFDYGIGIEWRPFSKMNFLERSLLRWIKELRFYTLFLNTEYLQYQKNWSWRPKTDFRYGMEFYKEYNLYNTNFFWTELWADVSWRKTNFFVKDYNSWVFAIVPKMGVKIFPKNEVCIMPYFTGEFALTQRYEFWQNRILIGGGIRFMPFRWNGSRMNVFIKGLRLYLEYIRILNYFDDKAPTYIPKYDLRAGINYTINWW